MVCFNFNSPSSDLLSFYLVSFIFSYRKWDLGETQSGTPVVVVARTELDGAIPALDSSSEPSKLLIKAFNEWDSQLSGGVQWRTKLDQQKAAVLASELKNNGAKLAKWTLQVNISKGF